jgi:tetratricopeptide (TPR) repeat protein
MTENPRDAETDRSPSYRLPALVFLCLLLCSAVYAAWAWPAWRAAKETRLAFQAGDFARASAAAKRWTELRPGSIDAQIARGKAAIATGRERDAVAAMRAARSLRTPSERLALLRAYENAKAGRFALARPVLERAFAESKAPDPMLYETLARTLMVLYDFPRAGTVLKRWTAEAPNDARPPFWHSIVHRRLAAEPDVVFRDFHEALRRDPKLAEARLGLAELLFQERRYEDAAQEFDTYLKQRPNSAAGHVGAGRNDLQLRRDDDARRHFVQALANDSANPSAHLELAKLELRHGKVAEALEHLDQAVVGLPADPTVRYNRALALKRLGRLDESAEESAEFQRLQKDQEVAANLQKRLGEAPDDVSAQVELARWMFSHGYEGEGLRWSKRILVETPGQPDTCLLLADYYASQGRDDLAAAYLAQSRNPAKRPPGR